MVIIEGPDCAGKTTLQKLLVTEFERTFQRYMQPVHLTRLPDCHDRCMDYIGLMNDATIFDRFHLSEYVYTTARSCNEPLLLTDYKLRLVNSALSNFPSVHIVLCPTDSLIKKRFNKEREMYDLDLVLRAAHQYRVANADKFLIDLRYKFDEDVNFDDVIGDVLELWMQKRNFFDQIAR